jgi:hypothetical protein
VSGISNPDVRPDRFQMATTLADWGIATLQGDEDFAFGLEITSAPQPATWIYGMLTLGALVVSLRASWSGVASPCNARQAGRPHFPRATGR